MNSLVIFFAQYLPYILIAVFLLLLIFSKKDRKSKINFLIFTGISVFLARVIFTELIRYFYYVPRPFVNNNIIPLIFHEATGSFPSGHAVFFFALAMAIYFFHKRWSILFFVGALLIGLARVIAGIHWPIDVLGGAVIGIISSVLVAKFFKKF